jgi:glutamate-1-semialdehyde 2,1-aminomutase
MRGGYHGTHDVSLIANGRFADPDAIPPGLIAGAAENTVLLPFNDLEESTRIIEAEKADLAAVIVEPILGGTGMIPATREYLQGLRALTERNGILLIMDEVVTFPVSPSGAQGLYGIVPDLTTLGKSIGGGLPLAVFGGRKEIVELIDPEVSPMADYRHASTLGGSPVPLSAGLAQLRLLTPEVVNRIGVLGDRLRTGVNEIGTKRDVPLQSTGVGHLWAIHWGETPVVDFETVLATDRQLVSQLALATTNEGYFFRASGNGIISAAMDELVIDGFLATLDQVLDEAGFGS